MRQVARDRTETERADGSAGVKNGAKRRGPTRTDPGDPLSQPRDRGSNPRTGTNLPILNLSVACEDLRCGLGAVGEALFGRNLKDS